MLTKWWNWELMLATNFGTLWTEVTNFGSQNFGYQIWFIAKQAVPKIGNNVKYNKLCP